jgi:hypothetical protein
MLNAASREKYVDAPAASPAGKVRVPLRESEAIFVKLVFGPS